VTVVSKDLFTGGDSAILTSGSGPFTTTDGAASTQVLMYDGSPATNDRADFVTAVKDENDVPGTITLRLLFISSTQAQFRVLVSVPSLGVNTDTLVATLSGTSLPSAKSVFAFTLILTRGAANAQTAANCRFSKNGLAATITSSLNPTLSGEQTPTGATWLTVGSSMKFYTDLTGRLCDGGGDPTLATGNWTRTIQLSSPRNFMRIASGVASSWNSIAEAAYAVTGLPMTQDQAVEMDFTLPDESAIAALLRWASVGGDGYYAEIVTFVGTTYYTLYRVTGGVWNQVSQFVDEDTPLDVGTATVYTMRAEVVGSQLTIAVNGTVHLVAFAGDKLTPDNPGMLTYNENSTTGSVRISRWQAEALGAAEPPPDCGTGWVSVAVDIFSGGDDADIEARPPDGGSTECLANGAWHDAPMLRNSTTPQHFLIESDTLRHNPGSPTLNWSHDHLRSIPSLGTDYSVEVTGVWLFDPEALFGDGWFSALVRTQDDIFSTSGENGYEFQFFPYGLARLMVYQDGFYTEVWSDTFDPITAGSPVRIRLCVIGFRLECSINGVLVHTHFDNFWPSGDPGVCGEDDHFRSTGVHSFEITRYEVFGPTDPCGGEVPCEGGDDNPYPHFPPPTPPGTFGYLYRRLNAVWVPVAVPTPDLPGSVGTEVNGQMLPGKDLAMMVNTLWRYPSLQTDQDPPPDTPLPPYYDPCGLLPQVPPSDVDPLPLVGRFIGISQSPTTILGPVLNGTRFAIGSWTPQDLSRVAASGSYLMTSQGGYGQYMPSGRWVKEDYVPIALAKILPVLSTLQSYTTSGPYIGHCLIDDFDSTSLWPPYGIPHGDLAWIVDQIRPYVPGIRLVIRGRPSQFPEGDPGFDVYEAQFKAWGGLSASAFGNLEYGIAHGWGKQITLDLNYTKGGSGSSGICSGRFCECSAAEVVSYIHGMLVGAKSVDAAVPLYLGTLGYTYLPAYLTRTGMIDAFATERNEIAGL
jgi:hypothetical protein